MTMRTYRYFVCLNGHPGEEKTSENDQPYSAMWESVSVKGMRESGSAYICDQCGRPMQQTVNPNPPRGR